MSVAIDWVALSPEVVLVATVILVLIADLILNGRRPRVLSSLALMGTAGALAAALLVLAGPDRTTANGTIVVDHFAKTVKPILIAAALGVIAMGSARAWRGEYFVLILSAVTGAVLLPSTRDLITFFVAFELLTLPGYALVGWRRNRPADEAAAKYFVLGVLATAVMVYGLSLLFGAAGSTDFDAVSAAINSGDYASLARVGVALTLAGALFKVAAVPVHFWAPDAYQGAPVVVATFLATVSKGAGLVAVVLMIGWMFPGAGAVWAPVLWIVAAVSMTVANLVALRQRDFVRLLAWSSIAQAGFLLVPLAVAGRYGGSFAQGVDATLGYFVLYALATIGAFVVALVGARRADTTLDAFDGLFFRSPLTAIAAAITLLSLAGIPPIGGWYAKFLILQAAIDANSPMAIALGVIVALNTAIALAYYAAVVRRLWRTVPDGEPVTLLVSQRILLAGISILLVILGVLPGMVSAIGGGTFLGL